MSSFDSELLQRLADADAHSPAPGGASLSPMHLLQAAARRTRRQLAAVALMLLAATFSVGWWTSSRQRDDGLAPDPAVLALNAELRRLQALVATWCPTVATDTEPDDAARARLRCELAEARAEAVLAATPSPRESR